MNCALDVSGEPSKYIPNEELYFGPNVLLNSFSFYPDQETRKLYGIITKQANLKKTMGSK